MSVQSTPLGWKAVTLKDVAANIPNAIVDGPFGSNLKTDDYVDAGIPVLQGKNITNDTFRWFDVRFVSEKKANDLMRSSVRSGDILLIKIGSIGYSAIVDSLNGFDFAIIPANLVKITPNSDVIFTGYLHHWLTSPDAKNYLIRNASKTAQPALSLGKIRELPVPLPTLPEQRRIAAILDKANALRAKRREALAQFDRLAQSIFVEMFGDPKKHIEAGSTVGLAEVVAPTKLVTYGIVQAGPEFPGGVPYIKTGDIKEGLILEGQLSHTSPEIAAAYRRSAISSGDIVMSIRATVGTTALVPPSLDGANLTQGTARISPGPEVHGLYLLNYLRTGSVQQWIQAQVKGATFREITLGKLRELPVVVPKPEVQRVFVARYSKVQKIKADATHQLSAAEQLFLGIQQRAFRGDL